MRPLCLSVILLFIFLPEFLSGQGISNIREKTISSKADTVMLDTLSVVPNSITIRDGNTMLDTTDFTVNYAESYLVWKKKPLAESVKITYRVFPFSFAESYRHKDIGKIEPDVEGYLNPFAYTYSENQNSIFNLKGLNKQGSISRGISFGNNQDLSVNSNLNLQLSGKISDKVSILAAITDDNIPIQPDGNTQQLQEFDQVYIQLFDKNNKLIAGDFQLKRPNSYFMNYFKKAQGGSFTTVFNTKKKNGENAKPNTMRMQASAAVSKGKFARNIITGIEGNQGPYRLTGANNETFIIILSGTERVFIDGVLLKRGQENDYVIDYNTAEVIFTAKKLITKDKRIIIEFQYSDKNYARSLFQFSNEYRTEKVKLRFNLYSEQDSKNQPLQQDLNDTTRTILASIGDSLQQAISNAIYPETDTALVVYRSVDSLGYSPVFVYFKDSAASRTQDTSYYRLAFSNVGQGSGDYVKDLTSAANGRVFKWVAPDTVNNQLVKKGSYAHIILLATPKKKQMVTFGGDIKLSDNTTASFEFALSNEDINTFSGKDASDNIGYALKVNIINKTPLSRDSEKKKPWTLVSAAGYEQVQRHFTPIERYRPVEFERNWNIGNLNLVETQHIPNASIGLARSGVGHITYHFNSFIGGGNEFNGYKNRLTTGINKSGWLFDFSGSLMQAHGKFNNSEFLRNKAKLVKKFRYFTLGIKDDYEKNRFRNLDTDSLLGNSYEFFEWEAFISNPDTAKNRYTLSYTQRDDYASWENYLKKATFGRSMTFGFDILKNPKSKLRGKTTYRIVTIRDSNLTAQKADSTLLSRLEYSIRLFKGAITSTSFYEIGSGLEVKKEYSFLEVPTGQGVWIWTDRNNDGVKQLNEFEQAPASLQYEANYIRVFTPTNDYEKVFTNQFNQMLYIRPAAVWNSKKGIRKALTRFANQVAYRIDRKTNNEDMLTRFNPFPEDIADTTLLSLNSSFRNTFYFNKAHPKLGIDLNYQDIRNKVLFTNGLDSRSKVLKGIKGRWNITRMFLLNLGYTYGDKVNTSEFLPSKNYDIFFYKYEPKLTFQPGTTFRTALFYEYSYKKNDVALGGEKAISRKIGTDIKFTSVGKGSLLLNANFIEISYKDTTGTDAAGGTSLAFEMLEGLQPGKNITWSVSWQRTLANNLQLSLSYNGRKSEGINTIHAGSVQVRAFF